MTRMSERKSRLIVEFSDAVRERGKLREVTMEFSPYAIKVRLKGMRQAFLISPARVYNDAVRLEVERKRAERKERAQSRTRSRLR